MEDKSVLRWGGLAGIIGGVFSIVTFVVLFALVPPAPSDPSALVDRFPSVRTATIVGESILLAGYILYVILILALYRALHAASPAPALFGSGLGFVGYTMLIAGGLPPVAFSRISDLYHSSTATAADRATLALVWQGLQALFNETDTMGFVLLAGCFILLGIAMIGNSAFGKIYGAVTIASALAMPVGISLFSVDSSLIAPFAILGVTVIPIILGWKVYSQSRAA